MSRGPEPDLLASPRSPIALDVVGQRVKLYKGDGGLGVVILPDEARRGTRVL